jgi:hypothetical protein
MGGQVGISGTPFVDATTGIMYFVTNGRRHRFFYSGGCEWSSDYEV